MHFENHGFRPVILGGDITAYNLARTFHEAYRVKSLVVSQRRSHLCADSNILDNLIVADMDREEVFLDTLEDIARQHGCSTQSAYADEARAAAPSAPADAQPSTPHPPIKLILLACGDWYVRLIVEHRAQLERAGYIIPYIAEELLNLLVLKDSFYALCDTVGVPHPRTFVYDVKNPVDLASADLTFPLVAKPASSAAYHYADFPGKRKVFFFDDLASLEEMLANLRASSYDHKFLLQEFIPGDDTQMRILTTYSDRTGRVRFAAFGQTLLEDKKAMGIGNPVAIISREHPGIVEDARRLLEAVGYTGFANFDIKIDPRTGAYYFFEINTRLGRSNYYVTASGHNVATWIVDDLINGREFAGDTVIARGDESLYTVVPRSTLLAYAQNPELKAEIRRLYAEGKATDPIDYAAEERLIRRIYPKIFLRKQKKAFATAFRAAATSAAPGAAPAQADANAAAPAPGEAAGGERR